MSESKAGMGQVIKIDEARIQDHLGQVVHSTVEDTLNGLLDAEADRICAAARYERSEGRRDTRAGHYKRMLHTRAGEVRLKDPGLGRRHLGIQCPLGYPSRQFLKQFNLRTLNPARL